MSASVRIDWLFGRGLSIACGLEWSVPPAWKARPRDEQIGLIKPAVRREMSASYVDSKPVAALLNLLDTRTTRGWRHKFLTTNWDYLLQREILSMGLTQLPTWMDNSHVFHLNGTAEDLPDNSNRSPFLLEEDPSTQRCFAPEANVAFNAMMWNRHFVVCGMSYECATDKFLLHRLGQVEDCLPIGESSWIVVNPDKAAADLCGSRIAGALPRADVVTVHCGLTKWIADGAKELRGFGAIAP
jgi:hypothetical protein